MPLALSTLDNIHVNSAPLPVTTQPERIGLVVATGSRRLVLARSTAAMPEAVAVVVDDPGAEPTVSRGLEPSGAGPRDNGETIIVNMAYGLNSVF